MKAKEVLREMKSKIAHIKEEIKSKGKQKGSEEIKPPQAGPSTEEKPPESKGKGKGESEGKGKGKG
jgi:hypothetical protein